MAYFVRTVRLTPVFQKEKSDGTKRLVRQLVINYAIHHGLIGLAMTGTPIIRESTKAPECPSLRGMPVQRLNHPESCRQTEAICFKTGIKKPLPPNSAQTDHQRIRHLFLPYRLAAGYSSQDQQCHTRVRYKQSQHFLQPICRGKEIR